MNEPMFAGTASSATAVPPNLCLWLASFGAVARLSHGDSRTVVISTGQERELRFLRDVDHSLPAFAEGASCGVIFDGLLYNRAELQQKLADTFSSHSSDADLVLHAYLRWGEDVLHQLKGVFALIIWDDRRNLLLCVRDPLGVYPLYYADAGGDLLLSTSIDALTRHRRVSHTVNAAAIADYLAHRWPLLDETFFANVKRVPPGHVLRIGAGARRVYRYWHPTPPCDQVDWVREDQLEQFDELFDRAVNRLLDIGPAGIYLSGGLDSVSVAAVATATSRRRGLPPPLALSLVFPHPDVDEEIVQAGVATDLGLPQVLMPFNQAVGPEGLLMAVLEMSSRSPAPLQNVWNPAYHQLGSEGKRQGCQVILTGSGGDEWLGVSPLYAADLLRSFDVAGFFRLWRSVNRSYRLPMLAITRNLIWTNGLRPLAVSATRQMLSKLAPDVIPARRRRIQQQILQSTPWIAPDASLRQTMDRRLDQRLQELAPNVSYSEEMLHYLNHPAMTLDMEEVFENGRRMGLRIHHPYWDPDMVQFLHRTPPHLLNRGGRSKGLVRGMLARRFPRLGFEQQKKVVSLDFFRLTMMNEGAAAWKAMGGTPALAQLGIVDAQAVQSLKEEIFANNRVLNVHRIWDVLSLEAWLRPRL